MGVFGLEGYHKALNTPVVLLGLAAETQHRRVVERRVAYLMDTAMASGLEMGRRYVDPKAKDGKPDPTAPYYSFEPFDAYRERLLGRILPDLTEDQIRERREREEDAAFAELEGVLTRG